MSSQMRTMACRPSRPVASALPAAWTVHSRGMATEQLAFKLPVARPRAQRPNVDVSFVYEKVENKAPNTDAAIRAFKVGGLIRKPGSPS